MSRIADLLDAGRTMSFEFFPPKTPEAERALEEAMSGLAPLEPSFVSVTYGALGSTVDRTRDVVIRLNREHPFPAMSHLTCSGHRRGQLVALLEDYKQAGVENVLALAGDPPADGSAVESDYTYAIELVELIHEVNGFSVGVAAHPEVHPRSTERALDRQHLAAKLAVADFAVSQFFFDAADYVAMVDELAALGCTKPVIPGVMPIASVPGVRRMAAMNHAAIPDWLQERMDSVDGDPEAVRKLGVEVATELCQQLLDAGVPGLHLYALNRANSIQEIYANLGLT
jgi:methylenetetrahydrofolate reductase (NADPH)